MAIASSNTTSVSDIHIGVIHEGTCTCNIYGMV